MTIYFKVFMLFHLALFIRINVAELDTIAAEVTDKNESLCSGSIAGLVSATTLEAKLKVVVDIVSDLIPGSLNSSVDPEERLHLVYNNLAKHYGKKPTEKGLKSFEEAINDISIAKNEACGGASPLDLSDVPELIETFVGEYKNRIKDGRKLRNVYGKLLCINSTQNVSSIRRHRRSSHDCECPPEAYETEFAFHDYCHFFACLESEETLESIFFAPASVLIDEQCIAFVIDTTGSMSEEISDAKRIIQDFLRHEEELGELGCYILVPFNDVGPDDAIVHEESVGPIFYTSSRDASNLFKFNASVAALTAYGGGDGPEYALYAMLVGLRYEKQFDGNLPIQLMLSGSQMIVLTDAPSKQPELESIVADEAKENKVCIHFFTTNDYALSDGIYERIKNETGGILHTGWSTTSFAAAYATRRCPHLKAKRQVSLSPPPSSCTSFTVSRLATFLQVTIEAQTGSLVIFTLPNGSVSTLTAGSGSLALFSEYHPVSGEWQACASTGNIDITHSMTYILDATIVYLNKDSISVVAPPACTVGKVAVISSNYNKIKSATLHLIQNNTIVKQISLNKECDGALVSDCIDIPVGTYLYHLVGTDTLGIPFDYNMKEEVTFQRPTPYSSNITASFAHADGLAIEMEKDEILKMNFTFINSWKYDAYYNFTGSAHSGFRYLIRPAYALVPAGGQVNVEMMLRLTDQSIKRGTSHSVNISASICESDIIHSLSMTVVIKQIREYASDCSSCNGTCATVDYLGSSVKRCQTIDDSTPVCSSSAPSLTVKLKDDHEELRMVYVVAGSQLFQYNSPPACAYGRLGFVLPDIYQNASRINFRLRTFPRFIYHPLNLICNKHFLPPSTYAMSFPRGRTQYVVRIDDNQHGRSIEFREVDTGYQLLSPYSHSHDILEIYESQKKSLTFMLTNNNTFPSNFTLTGSLELGNGFEYNTTSSSNLPYWVVVYPHETILTEVAIDAGVSVVGSKNRFTLHATNGCVDLFSSINITTIEFDASESVHTESPTTEADECGGCLNGGTCVVIVRRRRVRKRCSCLSGFGGSHCQIEYTY